MPKAKAKTPWDKLGVSRSKYFRDKRGTVTLAKDDIKQIASGPGYEPVELSDSAVERERVEWFVLNAGKLAAGESDRALLPIVLPAKVYRAVLQALFRAGY